MTNRRMFRRGQAGLGACLLATAASVSFAQEVAPVPPTPPAAPAPLYFARGPRPPQPAPQAVPAPPARPAVAPAAPAPVAIPAPAIAPVPPRPFEFDFDYDFNFDQDAFRAQADMAREQAEMARAQAEMARELAGRPEMQEQIEAARAMADQMRVESRAQINAQIAQERAFSQAGRTFAFAPQASGQAVSISRLRSMNGSEDSLYQRGTSALDAKRWDDAVAYFTEAAAKGGPRADGALYWKAYALRKLGKNSEALAAIADLRKANASSRWLDDAKALEVELGKPLSPEAESDEELKLLALNGIMQTEPERAIPLVENQLKSSPSPRVKRNALFVLAQSSNPKAQAVIEQIARGKGNPDLQVRAISYLTERRRPNSSQILSEIYASTNDVQVKRAVLQAYVSNRDKDSLVAAVKNEKAPELRSIAISFLGGIDGNAELWQLYQSETTVEGKEEILRHMYNNGNADKLLEVVRTEKEPRIRRVALQVLGSQKNANTTDQLVQIYNAETDPQIKNTILDSLSSRNNAVALIAMAKAEKDAKMKLRIVERISNMASRSKEARDYLEDLLK